jgi:hypothetical protein
MSGVLLPDSKSPHWPQDVANVLSLERVTHGLHQAFDPGHHGQIIDPIDMLVLAAWAALALAVALRRFAWPPVKGAS